MGWGMGEEEGVPGLHGTSALLGKDRKFYEHPPTTCVAFDILMADLILWTTWVRLREVKRPA